MDALPILVGVAVVAFVAVLVFARRQAERKRTEALRATSAEMGFAFAPDADLGELRALGDFPLYGRGHSKAATNVLTGRRDDRDVTVFDYRYTTGGGQHSQTHHQTVVICPRAATGLPDLVLAPEHLADKIGQVFGYQDIDFESNPGFSSHYLLRGPDESAIRAAFSQDALSFFEGQPGWNVEVRNGNLGIYRAGRRADPDKLPAFLSEVQPIVGVLTGQ